MVEKDQYQHDQQNARSYTLPTTANVYFREILLQACSQRLPNPEVDFYNFWFVADLIFDLHFRGDETNVYIK